MRRSLTLMIFVLFVCLAQMSQARNFALLIGVDEYVSINDLKTCVNDVKTLKAALMKIGFEEDDIQIMCTGCREFRDLPTKKNIERRISRLISDAEPSDFVFFAFSGQGYQNGKDAYICPPDMELDDLEGTTISISKIMEVLSKCRAKQKWIVIDACRYKLPGSRMELQEIDPPPAGVVLFQSCSMGEGSFEDTSVGNGYFTKNLAEALSGMADYNLDGRLTLLEVIIWTANQTQLQVEKDSKRSQHPSLSGTISNYILTENQNIVKAKTLLEEAKNALDSEDYAFAIEKFDAAIALYPKVSSWKRDRELAQKMKEMKEQLSSKKQDEPSSSPEQER